MKDFMEISEKQIDFIVDYGKWRIAGHCPCKKRSLTLSIESYKLLAKLPWVVELENGAGHANEYRKSGMRRGGVVILTWDEATGKAPNR